MPAVRRRVKFGAAKSARLAKALKASKRKYNPSVKLTAAVKPTKTFAAMVDKVLDKQRETKRSQENGLAVAVAAAGGPNGNDLLQTSNVTASATASVYAATYWPRGTYLGAVGNGSNLIVNNRLLLQLARMRLRLQAFYKSPRPDFETRLTTEVANKPCLVRYAWVKRNKMYGNEMAGDDVPHGVLTVTHMETLGKMIFWRPQGGLSASVANMRYNDQHFLEWSPAKMKQEYKDQCNVPPSWNVLKHGHVWLKARPAISTMAAGASAFNTGVNNMTSYTHQFTANNESAQGGLAALSGTISAGAGTDHLDPADEKSITIDMTNMYSGQGILEWDAAAAPNSGILTPKQECPILIIYQRPDDFLAPAAPTWHGHDFLRTAFQISTHYEWQD